MQKRVLGQDLCSEGKNKKIPGRSCNCFASLPSQRHLSSHLYSSLILTKKTLIPYFAVFTAQFAYIKHKNKKDPGLDRICIHPDLGIFSFFDLDV